MACIRMRPCQSDNVVMHRHRSCLARPHSHHDFITLEPGLSRTNLRTGGLQRDKIVMHARGNSTAFPPLRKLPRSTLQPVAQPLQPATLQPVAQPLQHSTLQPCNLQPCSLAASSFAACTHSTSRCGRGRLHYWPKAFKFTPVSRHRESVLAYASSSSGSGLAIGDRPAGPDFGRIATWRAPTSAFRPEGRFRCFLITDRPKSGPVSGSNSPVSVWVAVWSSTQIF